MAHLLIARTTAVIKLGSRTVRIRRGVTVVAADDPAVMGREHLFRPLTVTPLAGPDRPARPSRARRRAEQATAAPGETRATVDTTPDPDPAPDLGEDEPSGDEDDLPTESPAAEAEPDAAPAEPTAREVRAWAREQVPPIEVPSRGKIPEDVVAAYKREHGGAW